MRAVELHAPNAHRHWQVGDRLEAELGQVKQAEEKQEATRARAAVREKTAKAQQAKSIIFVLLLAGAQATPRGGPPLVTPK